jgi:hypothetical protein
MRKLLGKLRLTVRQSSNFKLKTNMKKQATEAQKQAAEARRERFRGICRSLASMTDAQKAEFLAKCPQVVTCEGHPLSDINTMMLATQFPQVSVVGGFRQWRKLGRYVQKGQKALGIWIPKAGKVDPDKREGEISSSELCEATSGRRFLIGSVFDISMTAECGADDSGADDGGEVESASPCDSVQTAGVPVNPRTLAETAAVVGLAMAEKMLGLPAPDRPPCDYERTMGGFASLAVPSVRPANVVEAVFTLEGGRE